MGAPIGGHGTGHARGSETGRRRQAGLRRRQPDGRIIARSIRFVSGSFGLCGGRSNSPHRSRTGAPGPSQAIPTRNWPKICNWFPNCSKRAPSRVYYTIQSGYDTHSTQLYAHARLLGEFAGAIKAFLDDLAANGLDDRVFVLAFSEFGRRVAENDSQGTDHGTAGPVFLAGSPVQGGLVGGRPIWRISMTATSRCRSISARSTPRFSTIGSRSVRRTCWAANSKSSICFGHRGEGTGFEPAGRIAARRFSGEVPVPGLPIGSRACCDANEARGTGAALRDGASPHVRGPRRCRLAFARPSFLGAQVDRVSAY